MAQSSVDLIVNAVKAVNPLRAVAAASKKAEQAIEGLKKSAKATGNTLADMGRKGKKGLSDLAAKARTAAGSFGKLGKAAVLAAAAAGAAAFLRFSFGQAGELERQTKSLQVLTGSLRTAKGIISDLQAFGAVTPFTSTELIETAKRMKAFGFETSQVVDITKRLADVAGATGADLGGIATAFGQIQAKGRLQGEELLQLQERGVALQDELRKMYGLTGEEFSKALQKGQISAKAAEVALIRLTEKGGKYANGAIAQSDTLFGKLSTLQDALQRFGQNIGKVLSPIFKRIIDFLTTITNQINNLFRESALENQARKDLGLDRMGSTRKFFKEGGRALLDARKEELRKQGSGQAPTTPDITIPELTQGAAGDRLGKEARERARAAAKEADALKKIAEESEKRVRSLEEQTLLSAALTEEERTQFERQINIANILENKKGLSEAQLKTELEATVALYEQQDVTKAITEENKKQADAKAKAQQEEQKRAETLKQVYQGIGDTISNGVVDALSGAVKGTASLADAATNMLNNLADQLLKVASNMLLFGNLTGGLTKGSGILGSLFSGFLANGGTAMGGRSYVVGEKGPELFTPGRTGSVAPAGSFGAANIVVNVDASGTQAQGNQPNAKALGAAIGAAVQAELVRQKRPGGLLSS